MPINMDKKTIKDLTVDEFKQLIRDVISEDIQAWYETFEIMANEELMRQIIEAEKALAERKDDEFLDWDEIKQDV